MESPSMMTRSMCSGECPSASLTHKRKLTTGKNNTSVDHHHHHHHHHHKTDSNPAMMMDDSSDEEITLVRRTTNKITTFTEISSRGINSVHQSFTKLAIISFFLPTSVFLFSWLYYDYSPSQPNLVSPITHIVSSTSLPHPPGQSLPALPFSASPGPPPNSQPICNFTSVSCPSQEEVVTLRKRLEKLEQLVEQLTRLARENHQVAQKQETPTLGEIDERIAKAIYLYDSDKTGKADYALESSGGSIIPSRCSETYDPHGVKYSIWGIPIWYTSNSPRAVIQASMTPGDCWAFPGSMGNFTVKLSARIIPTEFSYEHISKEISRDGNIKSAPKAIQIRGLQDENDFEGVLLGNYIYQSQPPYQPLQHFQVQNNKARPFSYITLIVLNNHGHSEYTCLYRFRVHGRRV